MKIVFCFKYIPVDNLVLLSEIAEPPEHRVRDLAKIFLLDLSRLLDHEVQAAAVHVLHADVDLTVTGRIEYP